MSSAPSSIRLKNAVGRSFRLANWARRVLERRHRRAAFRRDFEDFRCKTRVERFDLDWTDRQERLGDATAATHFDRHYVYHPAWAARILERIDPEIHLDVGSSLYFASVVSATRPVRFYDFRPADLRLDGLEMKQADVTRLPFEDGSIPSLSCMHVVEHIGLGRYGDPLNPEGDIEAMRELERVLAPNGDLLFVVPVGRPRIVFNAHRIYSYAQIAEQFAALTLKEFALIPEVGPEGLIVGASEERVAAERYGCGCFWFRRSGGGSDTNGNPLQ